MGLVECCWERNRKTDEANKLQAELNLEGQDFTGLDYQKAYEAQLANLKESSIKTGGSKGSKPKQTKAEKESERSAENYLNQIAEMTQRLSGLKADASDIALFGQTSQYQEVKKLTEDIALNAEKYNGYGVEGVAKLKELAAQIDSENQKIAIARFKYDSSEMLNAMQLELDLRGKSRTEQELILFNNQLEQEAAKLRQGMTKDNIALLDEEIEKLKKRRGEIQKQAEEARGSWEEGVRQGWRNIEKDVTDVAGNVADITQNAFNGMADAMTDFVMTGKADFRSMAESIIRDISNMIIKMMLFNSINSAFGGWLGGGTTVNANATYGMGTWATGGYTGDGGKYTPAGIVHRGEYVITKEATSRLGLDYLNYLNYGKRGFSGGGGIAVPRVPSISMPTSKEQKSSNIHVTQHYTTIHTSNLFIDRVKQDVNKDIITTFASRNTPYSITSDTNLPLDLNRIHNGVHDLFFRSKKNRKIKARLPIKIINPPTGNNDQINILLIGDSITNRGGGNAIKNYLESKGYTPNFIGTMPSSADTVSTNSDGVLGEAREGWETGDFTNAINDRSSPVDDPVHYLASSKYDKWSKNPFIRPSTEEDNILHVRNSHIMDFNYYQSRFNLATPDIVMIALGTNDIRDRSAEELKHIIYDNYQLLFQRLKSAWPNVKIVCAMYAGLVDEQRDILWQEKYSIVINELIKAVNDANSKDIFLCPAWALHNIESGSSLKYGFTTSENKVDVGVFNDAIHFINAAKLEAFSAISATLVAAYKKLI